MRGPVLPLIECYGVSALTHDALRGGPCDCPVVLQLILQADPSSGPGRWQADSCHARRAARVLGTQTGRVCCLCFWGEPPFSIRLYPPPALHFSPHTPPFSPKLGFPSPSLAPGAAGVWIMVTRAPLCLPPSPPVSLVGESAPVSWREWSGCPDQGPGAPLPQGAVGATRGGPRLPGCQETQPCL